MPTLATAEGLYLEHADLVDDVLTFVARRKRLMDDEAEEFAAHVKAWLVEDDYGLLRKYTGKHGASLRTYLVTALNRKFIDWRRSQWGKWRPSAAAKRDGIEAELLERYMHRDGFSFEETCEHLRWNHGVRMSNAELADLVGRLPDRTSRRMEGEETLEPLPAPQPGPERQSLEREQTRNLQRTWDLLGQVIESLQPEDQVILRMRFFDGFKVVDIARTLQLEQKPLYRRIDKLLKTLRRDMEERGVSRDDLEDLFR